MQTKPENSRWQSETVDRNRPHFELRYGNAWQAGLESWTSVALIGESVDGRFPVQWLLDPERQENADIVAAVREELDFYLVEKGESNPWAYAQYHCGTSANMYSKVHWSYFPSGAEGRRHSSVVVKLSKDEAEKLFGHKPGWKGRNKS